jgi:hypothetical protein
MYLYGRGADMNFARGVSVIRMAAEQNNQQAIVNYTETDFTILFQDNPSRANHTAMLAFKPIPDLLGGMRMKL